MRLFGKRLKQSAAVPENEDKSTQRRLMTILLWGVIVFLIYMLSAGPVGGLCCRRYGNRPSWFITIYRPAQLVYDVLPHQVQDRFEDYGNWWIKICSRKTGPVQIHID